MATSKKKVVLRTHANELLAGYLPSASVLGEAASGQAAVDLLDLQGRMVSTPLGEVRTIAFVRDFNPGDKLDPERLLRRSFTARPRTEGLWLRVTFLDGSTLEGVAAIDMSLLDGLLEDRGIFLIPPDIRSNTQRVFVPRSAMREVELLAVIRSPSKKPLAQAQTTPGQDSSQGDLLFPEGSTR